MICPICKSEVLRKTLINNTEIEYCNNCLGTWFNQGELEDIKNERDKNLSWLDIDLWKQANEFKVSYGIRICPVCRLPLYEVYYGDSKIVVDVCNICHGLWLDRAEFKRIIAWLKEKADYEIMHNYSKNLFREFTEVFNGPESFREELLDFIIILKLFSYKFAGENPTLAALMAYVPLK